MLSRFDGRTYDPMEDLHWSSLLLKDCAPWERTHAGTICEELQSMGRTHIGEVCGVTPQWSRGRMRRKEQQRKCVMN